jgi:DNA-binding NtrC family response regulator
VPLPVETALGELEGRSLLIVDDERTLRSAVARFCRLHGLEIREAEDVESARAVLEAHTPDFVLLDLHFPGGGGVEVLRMIGERHPALLPRTILMSGDLDGGASQWIGGGYACVLNKPFELGYLIQTMRALVG